MDIFTTNNLIGFGILAAILLLHFGITYLKNKGKLSPKVQEIVETADKLLPAVEGFLPQNAIIKVLFEATKQAVNYVEQEMKYDDNTVKKNAAEETTLKLLSLAGVQINDQIRDLIHVGIGAAVRELPPTNKPEADEKPVPQGEIAE